MILHFWKIFLNHLVYWMMFLIIKYINVISACAYSELIMKYSIFFNFLALLLNYLKIISLIYESVWNIIQSLILCLIRNYKSFFSSIESTKNTFCIYRITNFSRKKTKLKCQHQNNKINWFLSHFRYISRPSLWVSCQEWKMIMTACNPTTIFFYFFNCEWYFLICEIFTFIPFL